ncbi:hypothetical protein HYV80_04880 [Candidatus Woesearchaeota archaeon]|nr:hypothetical protein [Candidatus Woesearchaeota archaeon]
METPKKALVFNPNDEIGQLYSDILKEAGVNSFYANTMGMTVQNVVEQINRTKPNLAVVALSFDPNGKTLEGLEVLAQRMDVPVVVVHSGEEYRRAALDLGAKDYLFGALKLDEIQRRLLQALETQQ